MGDSRAQKDRGGSVNHKFGEGESNVVLQDSPVKSGKGQGAGDGDGGVQPGIDGYDHSVHGSDEYGTET